MGRRWDVHPVVDVGKVQKMDRWIALFFFRILFWRISDTP